MSTKPRKSPRCPICKAATVHDWRPFCSKRCADIDLGKWASGGYAIPTEQRPDTPDDSDLLTMRFWLDNRRALVYLSRQLPG